MKKVAVALIVLLPLFWLKGQNYTAVDKLLSLLEERRGINQNFEDVNIDGMKFITVKDFDDHTERKFIIVSGNNLTYVEVFDDKSSGESTSNVFSGDIIRKKKVLSMRADRLENEKIPIAVTKTLLITKQDDIVYLIDINTDERWIDEKSFGVKRTKKNKKK